MSIVFVTPGRRIEKLADRLKALDPSIETEVWPEVKNPDGVLAAAVWQHPPGVLSSFPNLKFVSSLGAGVDHVLRDQQLPEALPVTRIADEKLKLGMRRFVLGAVLNYEHQFFMFNEQKKNSNWYQKLRYRKEIVAGVMGLGYLGADLAYSLGQLNYKVKGYSNTLRKIPKVQTYSREELNDFLQDLSVLICLLPLTDQTKGILNMELFSRLPAQCYLINVARGAHLVETDLLKALEMGQLSGAWLDVFQEEPLPPEHSFWQHPDIMVTPHIASITDPDEAAGQLVENYHRMLRKEALLNQVDRQRQY